MKKLIFTVVFFIVALAGVEAQSYKWWVGGRTHFWKGDYITSFSIAPEVGYHLSPQFTLAASLGFNYETEKMWGPTRKEKGLIFNPYLRYTFLKQGIVLCFVDGGIDMGLLDYGGFQVGLKPGIAVLLSDRFTAATQFGFLGYNDGKGIAGRDKGFGYDLSGYCGTIAFFFSF